MSTPFLEQFAATLVHRLVERGQLALVAGSEEAVARQLAAHLGGAGSHASLISTISRALLASDDVEELYADDDDIKALVQDLDRASAGF